MKRGISTIIVLCLTFSISWADDFVFSSINALNGLSDNQVRYILQLPDGRMVFKTSGNINIYDGAHFKYIHQNAADTYPLKNYDGFYRIYQSGDSILWIKDQHTLRCVDLRTEHYRPNLASQFKSLGFHQPVNDFFSDSQQRIWLLTEGKLWTSDRSQSIDLSGNIGDLQDLSSDGKQLFLFYHTGNVVCYDLTTKRKLYTKGAYPPVDQHLFNYTSLVVKGRDGFYQLRNGSKGGFFLFSPQTKTWKKILETTYTLNTLTVAPNGTAYVSCKNGFWIINCKTDEKKYLPNIKQVNGKVLSTEISTVFYDQQGGLWLGTINQGLLYYHPSSYMFSTLGRSHFPYRSTEDLIVTQFAEDHAKNIYIKTSLGYFKYQPNSKDNRLLTVLPSASMPKEIIEKFPRNERSPTVLTDSRHWKWTRSADGLQLFQPEQNTERVFYTENGLANNFVHGILEDRDHHIWITTSSGINKIQIDQNSGKIHFSTFRTDAGTLEGEYADGSLLESTTGDLYFGGVNGFSLLRADRIANPQLLFKPIMTNFFINGEKIDIGKIYGGRLVMARSATYCNNIELSYDQNFLSFEFSGLNYQNPSQTYYRYQLQGIDKTWRETYSGGDNGKMSTEGILRTSYTNLPPGKYKLLVMASNDNLSWDVSALSIDLTIHAPWWKTTTAYIIFSMVLLITVLTSIYLYFYALRKKMERQHREEILLLRIRNLLEQRNLIYDEQEQTDARTDVGLSKIDQHTTNQADAAFLARAMEHVEKNLDVPNYSVEQLSRDLFMDRTGLYRKLIGLLDKSPSLFIRNIRLKKAASLLLDGELTVAEITERVGFSSSSYLSKCFQEVYGCRPSEYAQKAKKST